MGKRKRTIANQLNHAISESVKIGTSKRGDRKAGVDTMRRVYSIGSAERLRDVAGSFGRYVKERHPEVKLARDIAPEIAQEWLDERAAQWTARTASQRVSDLKKLATLINAQFGGRLDYSALKPPVEQTRAPRVRDKAISPEDLALLKKELNRGNSAARVSVELSERLGLRVKECARLRGENIDLERGEVRIVDGAKNGKHRTLKIRDEDISFLSAIKAEAGNGRVCRVQEDSLNKAIRRALDRLKLSAKYPKTATHAIRKRFAQNRLAEEIGRGLDERKAWEIVQQELGHGQGFRLALFRTYIGRDPE